MQVKKCTVTGIMQTDHYTAITPGYLLYNLQDKYHRGQWQTEPNFNIVHGQLVPSLTCGISLFAGIQTLFTGIGPKKLHPKWFNFRNITAYHLLVIIWLEFFFINFHNLFETLHLETFFFFFF